MKHYYYYIEAGREIDESARFYKVAVGSSKQAQRDFLFLTSFSVNHGHYFALVNTASIEFLDKVRISQGLREIDFTYCDARDLVRSFKSNTQLMKEHSLMVNESHQRKILDINYRVISNLRGAAFPIRKAESR